MRCESSLHPWETWDRCFYFTSGLVRKALRGQDGEFNLHPLDSMEHRNTWKIVYWHQTEELHLESNYNPFIGILKV